MKILITAIGITGKSTLRRKLVGLLRNLGLLVNHYDADEFKELRDPQDMDCLKKLPKNFSVEVVYLIEDIHAPVSNAVLPLDSYDLILYIKTDFISHLLFWLTRMIVWFDKGRFSWEQKEGWKGTGRSRDPKNIIPILKNLLKFFKNRKKWIREDLETIKPFTSVIIRSSWSLKGPRFRLDI